MLGDEHSKSHSTLVLGLVVFWAALSLCSSPLPLTLPTFSQSPFVSVSTCVCHRSYLGFSLWVYLGLLVVSHSHSTCYDFPFLSLLLYISILIPFYSIRTILPFHSHATSPWGFPRFPYLWLTSLEAYFLSSPVLPCTAKHCLMTHTDSLSPRGCASPLFPFHMTYYDSILIFPGQPLALPSMYKYPVGQPV